MIHFEDMATIRNFKKIILILPLLALVSCEDFLSKEPDSTRAIINTPKKVSQLLTTAYPQAGYVVFSEGMSDNVADKGARARTTRQTAGHSFSKSWRQPSTSRILPIRTGPSATARFR
jgi:hypothetical protein